MERFALLGSTVSLFTWRQTVLVTGLPVKQLPLAMVGSIPTRHTATIVRLVRDCARNGVVAISLTC